MFDGNFSAEQLKMKNPEDDVLLSDGHGFLVTDPPYKDHLRVAKELKEVGEHSLLKKLSDSWSRDLPVISMMPSTRQTSFVSISSTPGSGPGPALGMGALFLIVWSIFTKGKSEYSICFVSPGFYLNYFQADEHGLLCQRGHEIQHGWDQ